MRTRHRLIDVDPSKGLRRRAIELLGRERAFQTERRIRRLWARATYRIRPLRRPIFIWGAGRTGSYLLYDLLSLHPEIVCVRGFDRLSKGLYGHDHHGRGDYDALLENPFPPIEAIRQHVFSEFPEIKHSARFDERQLAAVERSYRLVAASVLGARRLMDKAPHYTFLLEMLERLFPNAQHIHCLRHPNAVAASYVRRMRENTALDEHGFWGWRAPGWEAIRDRSIEERGVWSVVETMKRARDNATWLGPRCIEVRYEELTAHPARELTRTLEYLELDVPARQLAELPASFPNFSSESFKLDGVGEDLRQRFDELVRELGYDGC